MKTRAMGFRPTHLHRVCMESTEVGQVWWQDICAAVRWLFGMKEPQCSKCSEDYE